LKNIETILIDLDDTLIIEYGSADASFAETITGAGLNIDTRQFTETIRGKARENWYQLPTIAYCKKVGISSWEGLWADFTGENENLALLRELAAGYRFRSWRDALAVFGVSDPELAAKLGEDFKRIRDTKHLLFPDTLSTLEVLHKKYKLGLITNGTPELQCKKIRGGGLQQWFQGIFISGDFDTAKPDPGLFDIAVRTLGADKEKTIMIGNNLQTDIRGAINCGLRAIWVNRKGERNEENYQPDHEVRDLIEAVRIIG
jgi:putative hydrolase of the HAD superfamily